MSAGPDPELTFHSLLETVKWKISIYRAFVVHKCIFIRVYNELDDV
jgi:hypothetical protein